jgi:hypothetical protein
MHVRPWGMSAGGGLSRGRVSSETVPWGFKIVDESVGATSGYPRLNVCAYQWLNDVTAEAPNSPPLKADCVYSSRATLCGHKHDLSLNMSASLQVT